MDIYQFFMTHDLNSGLGLSFAFLKVSICLIPLYFIFKFYVYGSLFPEKDEPEIAQYKNQRRKKAERDSYLDADFSSYRGDGDWGD